MPENTVSPENNENIEVKSKRKSSSLILRILAVLGIVIVAAVLGVVIYILAAPAPTVSTGERNPFTREIITTWIDTEEGDIIITDEPYVPGDTSETNIPSTTEDPPETSSPITKEEPPKTEEPSKTEDPPKEENDPFKDAKPKEEFYNILLCGKDVEGTTTDVMMVVSYDVKNDKVNILQIPRDSCIIDTSDKNQSRRVNAVFTYGYSRAKGSKDVKIKAGMKAAETVVEDTFGIVIHKYVYVDFSGFKDIVNTIGGVSVTVQQDMVEKSGTVIFEAGEHHLNGEDALKFVRFRWGYAEGDLGRVDAQKIFLSALIKKILSAESITKLPQLINTISKYMTTDISASDWTYFIKNATRLSLDSILMYTTPGQYYRKANGAYYYSLYTKENLEIINKAFNSMTVDITSKYITLRQVIRTNYDRISTEGKSIANLIDSPPNLIYTKK